MRQLSPLIATVFAVLLGVEAYGQSVLFIGNSFTEGARPTSSVGTLFDLIASEAGHMANVTEVTTGGFALSDHSSPGSEAFNVIQSGYQQQDWDFVVLQEYSNRPTDAEAGGNPSAFYDAVETISAHVEVNNPNAEIVLFETWARGSGHPAYPFTYESSAEMQAQLRFHYSAAERVIEERVVGFSPEQVHVAAVGDAWETHINGECGERINLFASDSRHSSVHGDYLSSLKIYQTIYQESVLGMNSVHPLITQQHAACLQVASETVVPIPEASTGCLSLLAACLLLSRRSRKW